MKTIISSVIIIIAAVIGFFMRARKIHNIQLVEKLTRKQNRNYLRNGFDDFTFI